MAAYRALITAPKTATSSGLREQAVNFVENVPSWSVKPREVHGSQGTTPGGPLQGGGGVFRGAVWLLRLVS